MGLNGFLGHGQNPHGQVINLTSPFSPPDKACVLSGGLNSLVNQHNFESDSAEDYGQLYGLDVMGSRSNGFRTNPGYTLNPKPAKYEAYAYLVWLYIRPVMARLYGLKTLKLTKL